MAKKRRSKSSKRVEAIRHDEAKRTNIPTAEYQAVLDEEHARAKPVTYEQGEPAFVEEREARDVDLDPQLVWRGKDQADWSDLVVQAPPLYIQEKVHPKVLIDDLKRHAKKLEEERASEVQPDLFADFAQVPEGAERTEFYEHEGKWQNRMILGDSLQVMACLAEREGLRGKVQCIYIDPPYGIKFNSNFQWSTTTRDVKDGKADHITREPEQVKAFRDTWRDGIHSYLTYLRDRLTVARGLLTESGSIFVQIGDENVHRVRALMDEVLGEHNFVVEIHFQTAPYATSNYLPSVTDSILWYSRSREPKYRPLFKPKTEIKSLDLYRQALAPDGRTHTTLSKDEVSAGPSQPGHRQYRLVSLISQGRASQPQPVHFDGQEYLPPANSHWKVTVPGMYRAMRSGRVQATRASIQFRSFIDDFPISITNNIWTDTITGSFNDPKVYVVQTNPEVVKRCILMATDPGDLVLDPTCGSGTTASVAEQWGRRWITIDTSRVALALARARIMGARYPYYLLADSPEGRSREAEATRTEPRSGPTRGDIRHGFVYQRVPHITLGSIANNAEIDVIWERFQEDLEPLRERLNDEVGASWKEWEIPREAEDDWSDAAKAAHEAWWARRIERQKEIDASIAAKADHEYLYDQPYEDKNVVRVAGPFTVESLSPHRIVGADEDDQALDPAARVDHDEDAFVSMILDNLRVAGVQQSSKDDRIAFSSLTPWPGEYVAAEGRYVEGDDGRERRAGVFVGPEFGTVGRADLVAAAREAAEAGFDVLVACAFGYDAHATEITKLGKMPVLKARMNADLHMGGDLKTTDKANLFVLFGEPELKIEDAGDGQIRVQVLGVDVFDPTSGEVRSDDVDGIACWFVDTDYDEQSFFVRQAYFLGANDPYKSLKTTLRTEIDEDAWSSLHSDVSRPFPKPDSGRIAVKVINHLGDEVMKVVRVDT
ncbi:MAG: site-specific DNA-methyltransferase [Trueperaceae bacterium]|nr:site-specific DNA-methyltransferase [Trueperaceae bacterium]